MHHYTTRLLPDTTPRHRAMLAGVILFVVTGAALASWHSRPAQPEALKPIIVVATQAPAQPTATPEAPRLVELADGSIIGYDPAHGWQLVRAAPPAQPEQAAATAAPEPQVLVIRQASAPQAQPEEAAPDAQEVSTDWHPPMVVSSQEQWHPPMALPSCQPGWHAPLKCE